jgi:hypothetical protein
LVTREVAIVWALLTAGCGAKQLPETHPVAGAGSEIEIGRTIEQALEADAQAASADSLYAPYATVIADGRLRRGTPRYAGVAGEGEIAITNTQLQIRGAAAWGNAEYRWVSVQSNHAEIGRASFVLVPAQGREGWWIVQAHSSTVRR